MNAPIVHSEEYDPTNPRHRKMRAHTDIMQIAALLARDGEGNRAVRLRDAVDELKRVESDAIAAIETARKEERERIAQELETSGYDGWHIAAAFVRGNKREGQDEASPKG